MMGTGPFIRGFYHTLLIQSFPTMVSMLKTEPRTDGYISLKFFRHSLVEGHVCPRGSTSHVLFPSSFLHGGRPSTIRSHDWTYSLSPISTVEELLRCFTPLYYLCTRPPGVLNFRSPVSSPRGFGLWTIRSLYHTTSQILQSLEVPDSQSPGHFTNHVG
jgi:hypothetical protein